MTGKESIVQWSQACDILGASTKHEYACINIEGHVFVVENRAGCLHIEGSLNLDQLQKIVTALRPPVETEETTVPKSAVTELEKV